MSGHSKWATIKHKKAAVDKASGSCARSSVGNLEIGGERRW